MAFVQNVKGDVFVVSSYREVFAAKLAKIKKEALVLSYTYGGYLNVQKRGIAKIELIFTQEAGYLLGESVWLYFNQPANIIYCEAGVGGDIYLVIVKNGEVYLDNIYVYEDAYQELLVFAAQQDLFDVYVYGEVPVSDKQVPNKVFLAPAMIKSYTVMQQSLIQNLPVYPDYKMNLVADVFKNEAFHLSAVHYVVIGGLVLLILWYYLRYSSSYAPESDDTTQPIAEPAAATIVQSFVPVVTKIVNPLQGYIEGLTTPDPLDIIRWGLREFVLFLTIPGWTVGSFSFDGNNVVCVISSSGGPKAQLLAWAKQHNYTVDLDKDGFILKRTLQFANREAPKNIVPLTQLVDTMTEIFNDYLPYDISCVWGKVKSYGAYSVVDVVVNITAGSPSLLMFVASNMFAKVLTLSQLTLKPSGDHGGIDVSLSFNMLGS